MQLVVGRIGRAHGVRGDLFVEPFTDEPDKRFSRGAQLTTSNDDVVTVQYSKWHGSKLVVHFVGIDDRTQAEELRGLQLQVQVDPYELPAAEDEYYDHQLIGMDVLMDDAVIGVVSEVIHLPAQDLIEFTMADERKVLLPFVGEFVPTVDVPARRMVITPPGGLLEMNNEI